MDARLKWLILCGTSHLARETPQGGNLGGHKETKRKTSGQIYLRKNDLDAIYKMEADEEAAEERENEDQWMDDGGEGTEDDEKSYLIFKSNLGVRSVGEGLDNAELRHRTKDLYLRGRGITEGKD